MFSEEDLIPISGLQHVMFCERQFALIHLEQVWSENLFTAEGRALHERVDAEHHESRKLFRQEYGMPVRSLELGIIGKCDLVEFYLYPDGSVAEAFPVEFKRGHNKEEDWDRIQLCAEALCISEMLKIPLTNGDFYYLGDHRRTHVELTAELFEKTKAAIRRCREILVSGKTPPANFSNSKCPRCSLFETCMPSSVGRGKSTSGYIQSQISIIRREDSDA